MKKDVTLPSLGTVMLDAVIIRWVKKEGEKVKKNEAIVEVETDKLILEVVSPIDGILLKRLFKEGEIVKVDEALATVGSEDETVNIQPVVNKVKVIKIEKEKEENKVKPAKNGKKIERVENNNKSNKKGRILITPVAKEVAKKNNINIDEVKGSGKDGLINKEDILKHIDNLNKNISTNSREEVKSISGIRKRIAENLIKSISSTAQVTNMIEVDTTSLYMLKEFLKEKYLRQDLKITFLPFIIKAAIFSLKNFPIINSAFDGNNIIIKRYINFGIAIESPQGLIVPVVHEIENSDFDEIVVKLNNIIKKVRENNLELDDLNNGTISISNGGIYGTLTSTPIIPSGQTALLWTGRSRKVPVVNKANQIVVGNVMNLCITYDHQVVDGSDASQFLNKIKEYLEDPGILLA